MGAVEVVVLIGPINIGTELQDKVHHSKDEGSELRQGDL